MRHGQPSRTAIAAAAHRAQHQLTDRPLVFEDPLAAKMLGEDWKPKAALLGRRSMRALIAARSRLAEDALADAYARGVRQHLVLGAGLDTFAGRNPHQGLKVFEADHPETQAWKRRSWHSVGMPEGLTFAPIDLEQQPLVDALVTAGVEPAQPLFVAWLGVTPYLRRETVMSTLRALTLLSGGVEIVFDYGPPPGSLSGPIRTAYDVRAAGVAAIGEPWLTHFEPAPLAAELIALDFTQIEDIGPAEINARYFGGREDGLRVLAGRIVRTRT